MGESERETFGSPRDPDLSDEDAAELEELRREAAILREQLENAVGTQSPARAVPAISTSLRPESIRSPRVTPN